MSVNCAGPGSNWNATPREVSEIAQYAMALDHFADGLLRLTRSVMIPHTTMPVPISSTKTEAITPAWSGAMPYSRLKKLGVHDSSTAAVNICRPPPRYAHHTAVGEQVETETRIGARPDGRATERPARLRVRPTGVR